jgi:hypothetical protein
MSALTFLNSTNYVAQFVARRGDQVIARLPGIAPGARLSVPTAESFEVAASTILNGNTYTSAPVAVNGATHFLAQVKQVPAQGTYQFEVVTTPSSAANQMQFEKTSLGPVTFQIMQRGVPLQSIVVADSFTLVTLEISDVYSIYAVINGVTTDSVTTSNPNATITAVAETSDMEFGYYTLTLY